MSWLNPGAALWAIPAVGIIVLLYILRMLRRDLIVPATFLWPARTEEIRANAPFQKLKFNWLMMVQILAALLLVAALMRPQSRQSGLGGGATVIILDSSASMGATDVAPSRFAEATSRIGSLIDSAEPGAPVALIEAGATPRVVFPMSSDPAAQRRALETVSTTDAASDMGESLRLAAELVNQQAGGRIIVFTDGVFGAVEDFAPGQAKVEVQLVGERNKNLAIQALGSTRTARGQLLFARVKNVGTEPMRAQLTMRADNQVVDASFKELSPGEEWPQTVSVPPDATLFTADLADEDDFRADNHRAALAADSQQLRVLLVSTGNLFLERAIALDPRVTLDMAPAVPDQERAETPGAGIYDIVVFDAGTAVPVKAKGVLAFGASGALPAKVGAVKETPVWSGSESSPFTAGVDWNGLYVGRALALTPAPTSRVLARFESGPAVVITEGSQTVIQVAFGTMQSDMPLRPAFPIFIANVLDGLAGETVQDQIVIPAGRSFSLPAPEGSTARLVSGQDATELEETDGRFVVSSLKRVGESQLELGDRKISIHVNLADSTESLIQPRRELNLGASAVNASGQLTRWSEAWRWVLLALLGVFGLEWWLYARRS
ncbi:MAG: BatA and WFA domain-containing protein [Fimbriimonadaceae bacterium]|nr:BatA and WFA domain-containing protein [Fimbriimonadaceae bacterium]